MSLIGGLIQSVQVPPPSPIVGNAFRTINATASKTNLTTLPTKLSPGFQNLQNFSNAVGNITAAPGTELVKPALQKLGVPSGIAGIAGTIGDVALSPGGKAKDATSVVSYIARNGEKLFTRLTPQELGVLKNEIKYIPQALHGMSQIHLDPFNSRLQEVAREVPRSTFINNHPQAAQVLQNAAGQGRTRLGQFDFK